MEAAKIREFSNTMVNIDIEQFLKNERTESEQAIEFGAEENTEEKIKLGQNSMIEQSLTQTLRLKDSKITRIKKGDTIKDVKTKQLKDYLSAGWTIL